MADLNEIEKSDAWLDRSGPDEHIVVSSRARYARNLPRVPFPMRARMEELRSVVEQVSVAVNGTAAFRNGLIFNLAEMPTSQRHFLKENHLISSEMEKGGPYRLIFLDEDVRQAIMVNEEDHLRLFSLEPGFQPSVVLSRLFGLEQALEQHLEFAFSPKYGFLTACPTNTGTGLRASVLLHLPALASTRQLADIVKSLVPLGLTIRGPYGENSENFGNLFQVSNEVTLGREETEIVERLIATVERIIAAEEGARREQMEKHPHEVEDVIWRAWGLLTHARVMTGQEAVQNLSKLRLGIDRGYFPNLTHGELNQLLIQVQRGHIQLKHGGEGDQDARAVARANLLRHRLHPA